MVELDLQKILSELEIRQKSVITVHGFDVYISISTIKQELLLITQVYFGGNYIPDSVRQSCKTKPSFDRSWIYTFVTIDEKKFGAHLNYTGSTSSLNTMKFKQLLDEFCWLADEWRLLLDEQDRNDLVYVPN